MATFVHLTAEKNLPAIRRAGIRPESIHCEGVDKGIFCMPVIGDFFATHQWTRELMRFSMKNPHGVYFRIPDDTEVLYGSYIERQRKVTAAQATAIFRGYKDKMGFQVIVPRKVELGEIQRYRKVPPLGWRFFPAAKGRKPCLCPGCLARGEYGSHQMRLAEMEKRYAAVRRALRKGDKQEILSTLQELSWKMGDFRLPLPQWPELLELLEAHLADEKLLELTVYLFAHMHSRTPMEAILPYVQAASPAVQANFAKNILYQLGPGARPLLAPFAQVPEVIAQVEEYEEWMAEDAEPGFLKGAPSAPFKV